MGREGPVGQQSVIADGDPDRRECIDAQQQDQVGGPDEVVPKQTTDAYINAFQADTYLAKDFTHVFREVGDQAKIDAYLKYVADWLAKD